MRGPRSQSAQLVRVRESQWEPAVEPLPEGEGKDKDKIKAKGQPADRYGDYKREGGFGIHNLKAGVLVNWYNSMNLGTI